MYFTDTPIYLDQFFSFSPSPKSGALAFFVGVARDHDHGRPVKKLFYECYASMADRAVQGLIEEAKMKWPLEEVRILHRVGDLAIGDIAVVVAVASAHREEAFQACQFLIEEIKHSVPVWKKQTYEDWTSEWVLCQPPQEEIVS